MKRKEMMRVMDQDKIVEWVQDGTVSPDLNCGHVWYSRIVAC